MPRLKFFNLRFLNQSRPRTHLAVPVSEDLLAAALPVVRTADDWQRRRKEILAYWHGQMGAWPALIEKPKVEELESRHRETFIQRKVRIEMASGQTDDGYLLIPDGPGPFPAVLV